MQAVGDAGGLAIQTVDPTRHEVRVVGRAVRDFKLGALRFDWPGTRVLFVVKGSIKQVSLRMCLGSDCLNLYVDNQKRGVIGPGPSSRAEDFVVARVLDDFNLDESGLAKVSIEVCKRAESFDGMPVVISAINVEYFKDGTKPSLVPWVDEPLMAIEFVGDSDTSGLRNLTTADSKAAAPETTGASKLHDAAEVSDVEQGWAAVVCREFGASPLVIAASGVGSSFSCHGHPPMADCYDRVLRHEEGPRISPGGHFPDDGKGYLVAAQVSLVVVFLGGNDFQKMPGRTEQEFVDGYIKLLQKIRRCRPYVPILCLRPEASSTTCLAEDSQQEYALVMGRCITEAVRKLGGADAGFYSQMPRSSPPISRSDEEDWSMDEHWSEQAHQKWGRGVIQAIQRLGLAKGPLYLEEFEAGRDFMKAIWTADHLQVKRILQAPQPGLNPNMIVNRDRGFTILHGAVLKNHTEVVRVLLASDRITLANVIEPKNGATPLTIAAVQGFADIVRQLLECDRFHAADEVTNSIAGGATALHAAAGSGYIECVRLLLESAKFTAVNRVDERSGVTPLTYAIMAGHPKVVAALVGSKKMTAASINHVEPYAGQSAIFQAATCGREEVMQILLNSGRVDVNIIKHSDGTTALHNAAQNGHLAMVKALIHHNGFKLVNALQSDGSSALQIGAQLGRADIVEALLTHRAFTAINGVQKRTGFTALHDAVQSGRQGAAKTVKTLLSSPRFKMADARESWKGGTALHMAAYGGHTAIIRVILDSPAFTAMYVRCGATEKATALEAAALCGHEEATLAFIQHPRYKEKDSPYPDKGTCALSHAAKVGQVAVVARLLLELPIDSVKGVAFDGCTPLHLAASQGHVAVVEHLVKSSHFPNVNSTWNSETALHVAAMKGFPDVAKVLLTCPKFTAISAAGSYGLTALHYACVHDRTGSVLNVFLQLGKCGREYANTSSGCALQMAISQGFAHTSALLLSSPHFESQLVNAYDAELGTALHVAASLGHVAIAQQVLDCERFEEGTANATHKAPTADYDNANALHLAAKQGHSAVTCILLQHTKFTDRSVNATMGADNLTALHVAVSAAAVEVVKLLLGSPRFQVVNAVSSRLRASAIHLAAMQPSALPMQELLACERFTAVDSRCGEMQNNALHTAVQHAHVAVATTLLQHPRFADDAINARNLAGSTALHMAANHGSPAMIRALKDSGRFHAVTAKCDKGLTALDIALARKGSEHENTKVLRSWKWQ